MAGRVNRKRGIKIEWCESCFIKAGSSAGIVGLLADCPGLLLLVSNMLVCCQGMVKWMD